MKRLLGLLLALSCALLSGAGASAAGMAHPSDKPAASEMPFVNRVTKDLNAKYPTPAAAEKGGYFRYNNEDDTGAISYANLHWDSSNGQPSQLWYDVHGKLLGADYSVPLTAKNSASAPHLWGVNPARWMKFKYPHVHYILKTTGGAMKYGLAVGHTDWTKAGGSFTDPSAATLVKLGKVKSASEVTKIFTFPAQWDMELWLTPNPKGAFAGSDPLVHPSKNAEKDTM